MSRSSAVQTYPPISNSGNGFHLRTGMIAGAIAVLLFSIAGTATVQAQVETVLHNFAGDPSDGAGPHGSLIMDAAGNLYGTTEGGGSNLNGSVFKIDSAGAESVLYSFAGAPNDGAGPSGGLIRDAAGNLYGTTSNGGSYDRGTVFKIDSTGVESVLYSFAGGMGDGAFPQAGLIMDAAGNLYGTTTAGGLDDLGTVFKIDSTGAESVLYSFSGGTSDGSRPYANLIRDAAGNLYGTTQSGGSNGLGTVFKIDSKGTESVLYSFAGGTSDGAFPQAGLIMDAAGNLYGTTAGGGPSTVECAIRAPIADCGTVFKIDRAGNESVLHGFTGGPNDGAVPYAGLIMDAAGNLYGTTDRGGSDFGCAYPVATGGCGTVFKIDRTGKESVLFRFGPLTGIGTGIDGAYPWAGVIMDGAGNLYGTTAAGGSYFSTGDCNEAGCGTVFKISFPVPFSAFAARLTVSPGPPPGFELWGAFTPGTEGTCRHSDRAHSKTFGSSPRCSVQLALHAPEKKVGGESAAIDPVTQQISLTVGSYSVTLPPGSFIRRWPGVFLYTGTVNGVALRLRIAQRGFRSYRVQAEASGVDLTTLANPVTVTLAIGQNTGTVQVNATD